MYGNSERSTVTYQMAPHCKRSQEAFDALSRAVGSACEPAFILLSLLRGSWDESRRMGSNLNALQEKGAGAKEEMVE